MVGKPFAPFSLHWKSLGHWRLFNSPSTSQKSQRNPPHYVTSKTIAIFRLLHGSPFSALTPETNEHFWDPQTPVLMEATSTCNVYLFSQDARYESGYTSWRRSSSSSLAQRFVLLAEKSPQFLPPGPNPRSRLRLNMQPSSLPAGDICSWMPTQTHHQVRRPQP